MHTKSALQARKLYDLSYLSDLETFSDHRGGERSYSANANIVPLSVAAPPEDTLWSYFLMNEFERLSCGLSDEQLSLS